MNHHTSFIFFIVSKHFYNINSNTTDATSGAEADYHSGAPEITPIFSGICVVQS